MATPAPKLSSQDSDVAKSRLDVAILGGKVANSAEQLATFRPALNTHFVFEGVFYISLSEYRITGKTRASALSSVELGHQSTSWRESERMRNLGRGDYDGEDTARENRGRMPL